MGILREWVSRVFGALMPGRRDRELEEELRLHLELAAEEAQRRGHAADQAQREARLHAGGVPQAMDALRDQRGVPLVAGLTQDVRLALRACRATPGVTAVAVASLALAIGANSAIFSILNGLLLRSLPAHQPERLVHVTDAVLTETGDTRVRSWSYPFWEQVRQRPDLFESATAWSLTRFNLAAGGETRFVEGLWVDAGFFDTLGVPAMLGRTFTALDDRRSLGSDGPVAVISYGYWQRQYGGAADAIGGSMNLNGVPFTIIGVTPPQFFGVEVGRAFDVAVPVQTEALIRGRDSALDSPDTNFLSVIARLRADQSL